MRDFLHPQPSVMPRRAGGQRDLDADGVSPDGRRPKHLGLLPSAGRQATLRRRCGSIRRAAQFLCRDHRIDLHVAFVASGMEKTQRAAGWQIRAHRDTNGSGLRRRHKQRRGQSAIAHRPPRQARHHVASIPFRHVAMEADQQRPPIADLRHRGVLLSRRGGWQFDAQPGIGRGQPPPRLLDGFARWGRAPSQDLRLSRQRGDSEQEAGQQRSRSFHPRLEVNRAVAGGAGGSQTMVAVGRRGAANAGRRAGGRGLGPCEGPGRRCALGAACLQLHKRAGGGGTGR